MATLHILAFGIIKDIFGSPSAAITTGGSNVSCSDLKKDLEQKYPQLQKLRSYMLAVNNEYADDELIIKAGDEIAVIPPVSGG